MRFLDFLDPMRNAEVLSKRYFFTPGVSQALLISLVRLDGEMKVIFGLAHDSEEGRENPVAVAPSNLDGIIEFLEACRQASKRAS